MGKGHRTSRSSANAPLSPNLPVFTNRKFSEPHPFGVWWKLHCISHNWLIHWSLVTDSTSSPSPLPGSYQGAESSNPPVPSLVPLAAPPLPSQTFPEVTYQHNKRHLKGSFHLGNSQGFSISLLEMGTETKYLFLIKHSIAYPLC